MNPTKYTCMRCGKASLEESYHQLNYNNELFQYLCDICYFAKDRPKIDFYRLKSITTIMNEPIQMNLWGDPLFLS